MYYTYNIGARGALCDREAIVMNLGIEYFDNIKLNGDSPLYLQIRELVAHFIDNSKPNAVFFAERELATRLKVNRRTLRKALLPFVESGQLQRNARGTVIRKPEESDSATNRLHSFLLETVPVFHYHKTMLSLVLYENMPQQVKFWTRTVEAFNRQSHVEVKITWISATDLKGVDFFDWYKRHSEFDIYLMYPYWKWTDNIETLPFSRHMQKYLRNEIFQTSEFCGSHSEFISKTAIIGIAFPSCVWNIDAANACEIEHLPERFRRGEVNDILCEAAGKLLSDMYISADYATIMPDIGYPATHKAEDIKKFFWQKLERIAIVAKRKKRNLVFPPSKPISLLEGINSFAAGDCFFVGSLNPMLRTLLANVQFRYEKTLLLPPEGHYIFCADINMAIHPQCRNPEAAEEFIRFMLSSPVQRDLAETTGIAPVRREELSALSSGKLPAAEIDNFIRRTKCFSPKSLEQFQKKVVLHPYYEQLLLGKVTLEDAFTAACEDFFLKNPKFADGTSGKK